MFFRRFSPLLALCCLLLVACSGQKKTPDSESAPKTKATPPRPHVVFISLDTVRPDWLECYGHPWVKTPNLAVFAEEALLFENAMTPASTTLATHTSFFTGKYPHTHGVPRNGFAVADENLMLPEVLRDNGYATAGAVGAFPLDPRFNFNQGFDFYDHEYSRSAAAPMAQRSAEQVNKAMESYLQKADLEVPQFLFLHYFDAHAPYAPPREFLRQYREIPDDKGQPFGEVNMSHLTGGAPNARPSRLRHRYAAEITYLDHHLGNLFEMLRQYGIWDNAIVLVTSDHGETLWDHEPYFDHGHTVFQAETRMVGLLRLPGAAHAGVRSKSLVSGVDWMPTILHILGIEPPFGIEGRPVDLDALDGFDSGRFIFAEATKPHERVERGTTWLNERKARAVRYGMYKYIRTPFQKTEEFYDLSQDPLEQNNLLLEAGRVDPDILGLMQEALDVWSEMKPVAEVRDIRDDDADTRQKLEALGYF